MTVKYCLTCGYVGKGNKPGSTLITIILFLCYIVPGIIYSLWRSSKGATVCPKCKAMHMIPVDSPKAKEALNLK